MGRNVYATRYGYFVRAKLYKPTATRYDIVAHTVDGKVFYAKDYVDWSATRTAVDTSIERPKTNGQIATMDLKPGDANVGDKVEYDGEVFRITDIILSDVNHQKGVRRRPDVQVILKLE